MATYLALVTYTAAFVLPVFAIRWTVLRLRGHHG